jgi:prepilin-type N-terminal cleavage/methylation domain-containing protein
MKINSDKRWKRGGGLAAVRPAFWRPGRQAMRRLGAFTLIELLTVISIIAVLAAFSIPVLSAVKRRQYISHAQAELTELETAIQKYHDTIGFYPPDNASAANYLPAALTNQLYYELGGTTNEPTGGDPTFVTLSGDAAIHASAVASIFGRGGFDNCSKPGAGEDTPQAHNFLPELKPNQLGTLVAANGVAITNLVTGVGGPDPNYNPLGQAAPPYFNPWRYKSSGTLTNNPGGYELWVQLQISGKKYLICNWSDQVQVNSPLP